MACPIPQGDHNNGVKETTAYLPGVRAALAHLCSSGRTWRSKVLVQTRR